MKVLAIIDVAPAATFEAIAPVLRDELQQSWNLYDRGVLREAYATASRDRIVFVLESPTLEEAEATLRAMPLIAKGLLTFELVELRPFANWSRLFAPGIEPGGRHG